MRGVICGGENRRALPSLVHELCYARHDIQKVLNTLGYHFSILNRIKWMVNRFDIRNFWIFMQFYIWVISSHASPTLFWVSNVVWIFNPVYAKSFCANYGSETVYSPCVELLVLNKMVDKVTLHLVILITRKGAFLMVTSSAWNVFAQTKPILWNMFSKCHWIFKRESTLRTYPGYVY